MKSNCNNCIIFNTFKNICKRCNKSNNGVLSQINKTKYYNKITAKDVADDLTKFFKSEEMKCKVNNENYIDKRINIKIVDYNKCNQCNKECDLCEDDDEI